MSTAIEGFDNKKGWWFTGGGSFVSNGYVIYVNGLNPHDPNPIALGYGGKLSKNLLGSRDTEANAAFGKIIHTLKSIADASAASEEKYLKLKIDQLQKNGDIEVRWFDKIQTAIEQKDYNSAFTLLLRRNKDLKEFKREIKSTHFKDFSKTNEFFNNQFYKYLAKEFEKKLEGQRGKEREVDLTSEDFSTIVDNYFSNALNINIDMNETLPQLKDAFIRDFENLTQEKDLRLGTRLGKEKIAPLEDSLRYINKKGNRYSALQTRHLNKMLTKGGRYKNAKELADILAQSLIRLIGNGLSTEAITIGAFQDIGASNVYSTGRVTYEKFNDFGERIGTVSQKEDVTIIECYGGQLELDWYINELKNNVQDVTGEEYFNALDKMLEKLALVNDATEIFEIGVNVKGYTSMKDLKIEGEGTFAQRIPALRAAGVDGLGEQLIFLLNNTTKGAIAEGQEGMIGDYIAAACVAWMWDHPEDIFNINFKKVPNYHKIKLFNSGGAYFSASQIMYQTIDRLQGISGNKGSFVKVNIKAPPPFGNYKGMLGENPYNYDNSGWQAVLKQRWDTVKADAMNHGTLSIHFDQKELNELLSNLSAIMG